MNQQNLHQITAAITWVIYQAKIMGQNGTFKGKVMSSEDVYGSWFTPAMRNSQCTWVRPRSCHKGPAPVSLLAVQRPPQFDCAELDNASVKTLQV